MSLRRSVALTVALLSLVTASGCSGSSLLDDLPPRHFDRRERSEQGYLGVMVFRTAPASTDGLRVMRVLQSSPASRAGLREGDLIREVYGNPFESPVTARKPSPAGSPSAGAFGGPAGAHAQHYDPDLEHAGLPPGTLIESAADLEAALRRCGDGRELNLVVARDNTLVTVCLRTGNTCQAWSDQEALAKVNAQDKKSSLSLPLLLDYEKQSYDPRVYRDYFGVSVTEPVVRYRNVDVLPVLFLSLFRYESVPAADAWRLKVLCWPFVWTHVGDRDAGTDGLRTPGQDDLIEL